MNKFAVVVLIFLIPFTGFSQNKEERNLSSFNEIKVSEAIKVYLHQSSEEKVIIETDNVEMDEVETEIEDGRLRISLSGNIYRNIDVRVDVYFKSLKEISSSSASSVYGEEVIKGDDFEINVSSAGSVEVKLDVYQLEIDVSSSGDAKVYGRAHEVEIDASSAGSVYAYDLITEIANISASSAGSVKINVTKSIEARASSGGSIRYTGSPERSNTNSSSGGSVRKSN